MYNSQTQRGALHHPPVCPSVRLSGLRAWLWVCRDAQAMCLPTLTPWRWKHTVNTPWSSMSWAEGAARYSGRTVQCPLSIHLHRSCGWGLCGDGVFAEVISGGGSCWSRGASSTDWCLGKKRKMGTRAQGGCHGAVEAENGVMRPQAQLTGRWSPRAETMDVCFCKPPPEKRQGSQTLRPDATAPASDQCFPVGPPGWWTCSTTWTELLSNTAATGHVWLPGP